MINIGGKNMLYWNPVIRQMLNAPEVVIYGAGIMGKALKTCITGSPYNVHIVCFLVENIKDNPEMVDDIPVIALEDAERYKSTMLLVALHEKHLKGALDKLLQEGFTNVVPISFDGDVWSDIRGNWLQEQFLSEDKIYVDFNYVLDNKAYIYVVYSEFDRELKEKEELQEYEVPIQVGAALTEKIMWPVRDNQGENISVKNRQYCELTALYWIWKNVKWEYVGLCHYRRTFQISKEQIRKLLHSDIDIVVTVPVLNFPNVRRQYCLDHSENDWNIMLKAIDTLCPNYQNAVEVVQSGNFYYAYNMFIAKKEILNQYCEWLFPILQFCEDRIGKKEDSYQNRYPGFLAERLFTIFLEHHKEYKLVIAKKHFFESV